VKILNTASIYMVNERPPNGIMLSRFYSRGRMGRRGHRIPRFRVWLECTNTAFPNFFQVGTTFISQNVLRTTLLLVPLESKLFDILNYSVWYAIHVNLIFFCLFWTNVQSKRTTRAEPEDHLWSADHSLRNAGLEWLLRDVTIPRHLTTPDGS
jgi:hypothetical protein